MEAISINNNAVVANTVMFLNHSLDVHTAVSKGMLMETLKKRMQRGEVCRFVYKKKNGEIRIAIGTLQKQAVEANVQGNGIPKKFFGMFAYLDLEKMAWRAFREENFVGIID